MPKPKKEFSRRLLEKAHACGTCGSRNVHSMMWTSLASLVPTAETAKGINVPATALVEASELCLEGPQNGYCPECRVHVDVVEVEGPDGPEERPSPLALARGYFSHVALEAEKAEVLKETEQLLVDVMGVLEQSDEEGPVVYAWKALRRAVGKDPL